MDSGLKIEEFKKKKVSKQEKNLLNDSVLN